MASRTSPSVGGEWSRTKVGGHGLGQLLWNEALAQSLDSTVDQSSRGIKTVSYHIF